MTTPSPEFAEFYNTLEEAAEIHLTNAYNSKDSSVLEYFYCLQFNYLFEETRYRIFVLLQYLSKQYDKVFEALSQIQYSEKNFKVLQSIWYASQIEKKASEVQRKLNPCEKYRIQRRYPHPPTIGPNVGKKNNMTIPALRFLRRCFNKDKYPSAEEIEKIAKATELTVYQVNNWFKNNRYRGKKMAEKKKKAEEEAYQEKYESWQANYQYLDQYL